MTRMLFPAMMLLSTPAMAHDGLHFHPHGIQFGWLIAALVGVVGGVILGRFRK